MSTFREHLRAAGGGLDADFEVTATDSEEGLVVRVQRDGSPALVGSVTPLADGSFVLAGPDGARRVLATVTPGQVEVSVGGRSVVFDRVAERTDPHATEGDEDVVMAPMPGKVVELRVAPGDDVTAGETTLVLEAMKLQNPVPAPRDGRVESVAVAVGDQVAVGDALLVLEAAPEREE